MVKSLHSPAEWGLFLRVLAFALAVPALMRLPLPALGRLLEGLISPGDGTKNARERSEQIIRTVESALAVGTPVVDGRCLTRGLTLYYFLRRAGVDLSLEFGAGYGQAGFSGHCWLMKDGEPYLERNDPRRGFVTMYRLPESTLPSRGCNSVA